MQEIVVIDGEITLENVLDGEVELEAITDLDPDVVMSAGGGITPSGTVSITENGVYDVTEYASADVDVQGGVTPTGTKQISITQNGTTTEDVTDYASAEITTAVPASAVDTGTKSISTNGTHDVVGYASASVSVPASAVDSGTKSITSNGTHDVIGYASASVAVPNSYSASDEGKVVSNGALVAQTSQTVTENGTYDTTTKNEVVVNVQGSGGYSIEDIIERNISGDIVYDSGTQTALRDALFQATSITSFSSTKITGAEQGRRAFSHNTALKSVSMPNLSIGSNTSKMTETFLNCTSLETLYLPRIGTNWGNSMCEGCSSLTDVNIDACVTLPQSTFRHCNALTKLDLPNCTKMMNTSAECNSLTALILRASSVCALSNQNALQGTPLRGYGGTYSGHVYVPSSLISSYQQASNWSAIYAAYNDIFRAIEGSEYE